MKKPNYDAKLKKLLSAGKKSSRSAAGASGDEAVEILIQSVLEENATTARAQEAVERFRKEYLDYNELRVSPPKEMVERMGKDFPGSRDKAVNLYESLNRIFDQTCQMTLDYIPEKHGKNIRRHLRNMGLSHYAASAVALKVFDEFAIPVDQALVDTLEMDQAAEPGSSIEDVQARIEKLVTARNALAAHELLRAYAEKNAQARLEWREQREQAAAEAQQKREEEQMAKAKKTTRGGKAQPKQAAKGKGKSPEALEEPTKQAEQKARATAKKAAKSPARKATEGAAKATAKKTSTGSDKSKAAVTKKPAKKPATAAPKKAAKKTAKKPGAKAAPVKKVKKAGGTKTRKRT
jgi:endonuclease III